MIEKYWDMLKWLTEHKMGYLSWIIYILSTTLVTPVLIIIMGIEDLQDCRYFDAIYRNTKLMFKGGKNVDFN